MSLKTNGFVLLHRRIQRSDLWCLKSKQIIVAEVCVMNANWRDQVFMGLTIKRGQWLTHYHTIKECCPRDISIKEVRGSIRKLASSELGFLGTEVVVLSGMRFLLLTIYKYETYQAQVLPDEEKGTGTGTKRAQGRASLGHEKGTTLTEEVKEVEQDKKTTKTRVPGVNPVAFQNHWNSHPSLKRIRSMTKGRRRKLAVRSEAADFRTHWQEAVDAMTRIPWMIGQTERKWRVDIDWFLKNDENWLRGLETVDTAEARTAYSRKRIQAREEELRREADARLEKVDIDKLPPKIKGLLKKIEAGDG